MKFNRAVFLSLLCLSTGGMAQISLTDSLKNVLPDASGIAKIDILNSLAFNVMFSNSQEALRYAEEALRLGEEVDYHKGISTSRNVLGIYHDILGNYDLAIEQYKKGLDVLTDSKVEHDRGYFVLYNGLGMVYARKGNYTEALTYYLKSLEVAEKAKELPIANILLNIALVYTDQKDYNQALEYNFRCKQEGEATGDKVVTSKAVTNIGIVYKEMKRYKEAIQYLEESLERKKDMGNDLGVSASLSSLGDVYKEIKDYPKALDYLDQAESIKAKLDDKWGLVFVRDIRAQIYIAQREFDKAEVVIKGNLAFTRESGSANKASVYERFYDLYVARKDYKNALYWHTVKEAYEDSVFNETKSKQLAELQTLYNVSQKEKDIVLLEKEKEEERFIKNIAIIISAAFIIIVVFGFYTYRLRQKKKQAMSEFRLALQQKEIENSRLREEELNKEIMFKNKELASYTINFVQKSELLEELKHSIQSINTEDVSVSRQLAGLNKLVENSYQVDREWEDFKKQFENVHANFFKILKDRCPELSNGDLKLCALLKLNMNMKEAAKVLGISPESVKTARYRLRKKLGLKQEENLIDYILNIDARSEV